MPIYYREGHLPPLRVIVEGSIERGRLLLDLPSQAPPPTVWAKSGIIREGLLSEEAWRRWEWGGERDNID